MIEFTLKSDINPALTVEEAERHLQLVEQLNYLIDEGFIQVEEGEDGQVRLYPA